MPCLLIWLKTIQEQFVTYLARQVFLINIWYSFFIILLMFYKYVEVLLFLDPTHNN